MKINVNLNAKDANAVGIYDTISESILVVKGSRVSNRVSSKFSELKYSYDRDQLVNDGVIANSTFTRDYEFNSPSEASSIILASNTNGRKYWKDADGNDLNSLGNKNNLAVENNKTQKKSGSIILDLLLKECDSRADSMIEEIEKKMIERTYVNTIDTDLMLKDILALKEDRESIDKKRSSLDFVLKVVTDMWYEQEQSE